MTTRSLVSKETLAEIKDKVDIVELIRDADIELRRTGRAWKGLCPMPGHDERTPSFTVNPDMNRFHCFGCGANGDAIEFLRAAQGKSFREAIEELAARAEVPLNLTKATKEVDTAPLASAVEAAAKWYEAQKSPAVDVFLAERSLTHEDVAGWGVGFSAPGLLPHLRSLGHTDETMIAAGLARRSDDGRLFEAFRNRLMWTIYDHMNRPVGFGARRLMDNDPLPAKFINTAATDLYKKSEVLFGLNRSRPAIRKSSLAIITEGYTDVVAFHLAGLPYSLASCGTALTESHVRKISRLLGQGGELVIAMDGDPAGIAAAVKALDLASGYPLTLSCILFPDNLDPEAYRREHGDEGLKRLFEERKPLVETLLTRILEMHDLTHPESVSTATIAAGEVLAVVHNAVLREQYERWLAMRLNTSPANISGSYSPRVERRDSAVPKASRNVEEDVLRVCYHLPQEFLSVAGFLATAPGLFTNERIEHIVNEAFWLDPDLADAQWRENLEDAFPDAVGVMKAPLPVSVIEDPVYARQFVSEMVERLSEDAEARRSAASLEEDLLMSTDDPAELMRRLSDL